MVVKKYILVFFLNFEGLVRQCIRDLEDLMPIWRRCDKYIFSFLKGDLDLSG